MSTYWDSFFGTLGQMTAAPGSAIFRVTDDDLTVEWLSTPGMTLLQDGNAMVSPTFKGGGTYGNSPIADGRVLQHAVFDNVQESFRFRIIFTTPDNLATQIKDLERLLLVRAPRYWTDQFYNRPVRIERRMWNATNTEYALISQGNVARPNTIFDKTLVRQQTLLPVLVQVDRQPFMDGAKPGTVQKALALSSSQSWNFRQAWAEDTTTPAGYIFCFQEMENGDIYAGGESEILVYSGGTWSAVNTSPVTLADDVLSVVLLSNGDLLFGENGRIIKRDSGGTWSVEDSTPTGPVHALLQSVTGEVYAGDLGQIVKRDVNGSWAVDDTLPAGQVYSLLQTANGRIYAGGAGEILRTATQQTTTDNTFQVSSGNDDVEEDDDGDMDRDSNDLDLFRGGAGYQNAVRLEVDIPQGATINSARLRFTARTTQTGGSPVGLIWGEDADDAAAFSSADNDVSDRTATSAAVNWTGVGPWKSDQKYLSPDISTIVQEIVNRAGWSSGNHMVLVVETVTAEQRSAVSYDHEPGDAIELIVEYGEALAAGDTWEQNSTFPSGNVRSLAQPSSGVIFAGEDGRIISSEDDGQSWEEVTTLPTDEVRTLRICGGSFYAGDNGNILKSTDQGNNWAVDDTLPTGYVEDLICAASGDVFAGDNGRILTQESDSFTPGQAATTLNSPMVANHHKEAQLTHIKTDDGGVFSDLYPASSFPVSLFPAVAAVGDAVYFGVDTGLSNTGPFSSLALNLSVGASATTSYTITLEYYNGGWTTLTAQDGSSQFSLVGISVIAWEVPSDWTTTAIDGVTGYWVRARLSALTGTFTRPVQQTRDIYSPGLSFVEIADDQTLGTVASLMRLRATNRSDKGGPGGSAPQLYSNRILAGVQNTEDHPDFRAFLNFSDDQNPPGVTVSVAVDGDSATSFVDNLSSITGRAVFFDAGAATLNSLADRVKITLATSIAQSYYGAFRVFLRGKQTGGDAGELRVRLKAVTGSGGHSFLSDKRKTLTTTDHGVIEFQQTIILPVSALLTTDELADETSITVQIETTAADADFYLYDLCLLPTSLHYIDAQDTANTTSSAIGRGRRLTVDSITQPKMLARGRVEATATGLAVANYRTDSNGPIRLLSQEQQRVWFLSMSRVAAGTAIWISKPEVVHSIAIGATDRWTFARGSD